MAVFDEYPEVGSKWHSGRQRREVVAVDPAKGRIRWKGPERTRWCKHESWIRWAKYAKPGDPPPEAPMEPTPLRELGHYSDALWGVFAPADPCVNDQTREDWLRVVSECLARGLKSADVVAATGLSPWSVAQLSLSLRERYAALGPGLYAERRERMWHKALDTERRALEHLEAYMPGVEEPQKIAALIKALIDSRRELAELCGGRQAPAAQVQVNAQVNVEAPADPVRLAQTRFGIDPAQLAELGDGLAGLLTDRAREVVDAEYDDVQAS